MALRERPLSATTATVKYQHTDLLGTPISVTDAAKAYVAKYEYEPYGLQINGTLQDGPGYTGHVQDQASGLTYMQQRYYEPSLGRFLSVDPVGPDTKSGSGFGRYHYAANNPYTFSDPDGRECTGSRIKSRTCEDTGASVIYLSGGSLSNSVSHAQFDRKFGVLEVEDADTGKRAKGIFFSGTGPADCNPLSGALWFRSQTGTEVVKYYGDLVVK